MNDWIVAACVVVAMVAGVVVANPVLWWLTRRNPALSVARAALWVALGVAVWLVACIAAGVVVAL